MTNSSVPSLGTVAKTAATIAKATQETGAVAAKTAAKKRSHKVAKKVSNKRASNNH